MAEEQKTDVTNNVTGSGFSGQADRAIKKRFESAQKEVHDEFVERLQAAEGSDLDHFLGLDNKADRNDEGEDRGEYHRRQALLEKAKTGGMNAFANKGS